MSKVYSDVCMVTFVSYQSSGGKGHIFHSMTITIYHKRTEEKLTI